MLMGRETLRSRNNSPEKETYCPQQQLEDGQKSQVHVLITNQPLGQPGFYHVRLQVALILYLTAT